MVDNENKKLLSMSLAMGITGAIIGGAIQTAKGIKNLRDGSETKGEVASKVLKESAGSGISTAVGAATIGSLKTTSPILGGLGFAAVTMGTKYLWDYALRPDLKKIEGEDKAALAEDGK
ncbi:MAG: hypothetical protein CSA18_04280 [Deltaproteobacteria bacterium]|nr:MAG: hypothetical protein CSA18_04280 [Deltaproteobacteria bacterium]